MNTKQLSNRIKDDILIAQDDSGIEFPEEQIAYWLEIANHDVDVNKVLRDLVDEIPNVRFDIREYYLIYHKVNEISDLFEDHTLIEVLKNFIKDNNPVTSYVKSQSINGKYITSLYVYHNIVIKHLVWVSDPSHEWEEEFILIKEL